MSQFLQNNFHTVSYYLIDFVRTVYTVAQDTVNKRQKTETVQRLMLDFVKCVSTVSGTNVHHNLH